MAVEKGYDVRMSVAGTLVNGTTQHSIDETIEMLDATTQDSSGNMEYLAGERGGTAGFEMKVDATDTYGVTNIRTAMATKAAVAIVMGEGVTSTGGRLLSFNAFINSLSESAPKGDIVTASVGLQITAGVTESTSATTLL